MKGCTLEETWCLGLRFWWNNVANSHLSLGPFKSSALRSYLVPKDSRLSHWPYYKRSSANCDWMHGMSPKSADNLPIFASIQSVWASSQRNHTLSSKPYHGDWISASFSARLVLYRLGMHGTSNRDTHLYLLHNISSVRLTTTTEMRRSGRVTNGLRSCWRTPRDSVLSFTKSAPTRNWLSKNSVGLT